jgi:hypothetical protein
MDPFRLDGAKADGYLSTTFFLCFVESFGIAVKIGFIKKNYFLKIIFFTVFFNCFDMLILKIIFLK